MRSRSFATALVRIARVRGDLTRKLRYQLVKAVPGGIDACVKLLNEKEFFLLTSTGRTGTTLFANMLNSVDDYYVEHEPVLSEQYYHKLAMEDPAASFKYIEEFRLKETCLRIRRQENCRRYGEVNGALRRHLEAINLFVPNCKMVHVIRDGREVVSSILNRTTLTAQDKIYGELMPHESVIDRQRWKAMSRFQKIVAIWNFENSYMSQHCDFTVRFEDLISQYEYAKTKLFEPLAIPVDFRTWQRFVGEKVNSRKKNEDKFSYLNWGEDQKRFFWEECGEQMQAHGYADT